MLHTQAGAAMLSTNKRITAPAFEALTKGAMSFEECSALPQSTVDVASVDPTILASAHMIHFNGNGSDDVV